MGGRHFSPSQNILIDNFDISQYEITENVNEVFSSIVNNYSSGLRSINLIGAYGTGKSTFLNAFEYHINQGKIFTERKEWKKYPLFDFLKLVGQYESIIENVKSLIGSTSSKPSNIIDDLEIYISKANKQKRGVILLIDEFGKFLEYASKHEAQKELYFLQQIAELINNSGLEAAFITTLHQDFSAYAVDLTSVQRNEWTKVKGRFVEVTFNEPVEQLLYLAGRHVNACPTSKQRSAISTVLEAIKNANAFPLKAFFDHETAKKVYPLDLLSASVLALALQQYGQNERSLFTFLNTNNQFGLSAARDVGAFYAVANVYDYLNYNLYSFLNSKANIHFSKWAEIKNALERVEGVIEHDKHVLYQTIVKTIGLLNIFSHSGGKLDKHFLIQYIETTSDLDGVEAALDDLARRNLISYNRYSHRFFYSETTIVDIDDAIEEASLELSRSNNIVGYLNSYFPLSPISAKRVYYQKGTPRIFEYKITDVPYTASNPTNQIDGFINLIFNEKITEEEILIASKETGEALLFAHFLRTHDIKHAIIEIEKAEIALAKYPNDKIIQRELSAIIDIQKNLLNYYLYEGFYDWDSVRWYYNGRKITFLNRKHLNSFLSDIADEVYPLTPVFKSELANKTKLSTPISSARKLLIEGLFANEGVEGLNIDGFPPQKSIYLSLLHLTGIHKPTGQEWRLQEITDKDEDLCNFMPLFRVSNEYVASTKGAKRTVEELYQLLEQKPFKLKRGFLDFWIPIYLLIKRDDYAMYGQNGFIPELNPEVLELLVKNPKNYSIKGFETDGIKVQLFNKYRDLLSLGEEMQPSNEAFIKTIVPFFKFYRDLKPYVKQTRQLSKKTIKVRNALTNATDPEKFFFEDLPAALGFDIIQLSKTPELLDELKNDFQGAIRELRNAYEELLMNFESIINSLWNSNYTFKEYKEHLRVRYQRSLKQYLLLPKQKTFYDRLLSPLDDRAAWLSSVAQTLVGKTLDNFSDADADKLQELFLQYVHELDNLNDIALQDVDLDREEVFKLQITKPGSSLGYKVIRFPKGDKKLQFFGDEFSSMMEKENRMTKIAILAQLLKDELEKDGK